MISKMRNDEFANIAAGGVSTEGKGLEAPKPEVFTKEVWTLESAEAPYTFPPKMHTREELYRELERQKEQYRPFMRKLAPAFETLEQRQELKEFYWREETEADRTDFPGVLEGRGEWQKVTIPHYGGPLGNAVTYYRTGFSAGRNGDEGIYLLFRGVDYIADVFVNGALAGSHEGFFAPFELDITKYVKAGENTLVVRVKNDFVHKRNERRRGETMYGGDKIYAATGPGYDDPQMGWHHCPPGMGIWQPVYVEVKNRCSIRDIYVRPLPEEDRAEVWMEIFKSDPGYQEIQVNLSLYGRNFRETVFENLCYKPSTGCAVGLGDSFTEANLTATGELERPVQLFMEKGMNYLRIPISMKGFRWWTQKAPYLYEIQAELRDREGCVLHRASQSFGMRSFYMDTEEIPRGNFYLNGEKIRLRGANTMGHEQQCVMKGDMEQLVEDILLAKICNMNFLRLTQRPVQEEVYEYCDMLGLMTQTDLPLFGVLRIPQFAEALRQAEEMEKIVRKHPCNILVSYINEPFPNAYNQPHRHLSRTDLMRFFTCADEVVRMNNPERVTKHVDGDYDPPSTTLPDNHCYTMWYNGSGVDAGALYKGYWLPVKKDWNYGCGEFGTEGLDSLEMMEKYYPGEWLPDAACGEKDWTPAEIVASQSWNFHFFFYDTPHTLKGWIQASQEHQARATKWMTEAFRRNKRMVSMALHLFIDAFPAGWMKAVMDADRNPKPAYFAYRDALTPVMLSLRADRMSYCPEQRVSVEVWGCNDENRRYENAVICYQAEWYGETEQPGNACPGILIGQGTAVKNLPACSSSYLGSVDFEIPRELGCREGRGTLLLTAGIRKEDGELLHYNQMELQVRRDFSVPDGTGACLIGDKGKASEAARELGLQIRQMGEMKPGDVFLADDWSAFERMEEEVLDKAAEGFKIIFFELDPGTYRIGEAVITVKDSGMLPMHFVSSDTGHRLTKGFGPCDFRNWYDRSADRITPILETTFTGEGFIPILQSGNTDENGEWGHAAAAAEIPMGQGKIYICQVKLAGRMEDNPAAKEFAVRMISPENRERKGEEEK